jgi:3-oxoadipate enol-lactonase
MPEQVAPGIFWPKDRSVTAGDGAEITYTFMGPPEGRVVALCSGFMCPDTWWWYLAPTLARNGHRVLLFHYRGVGASTVPQRPNWLGRGLDDASFTIERFAADLGDVVAAEQIDDLVLVGHSMGVQVAMEAYRQLGSAVSGLVALTGPYASAIRTLYNRREVSYLLWEPVRLLQRVAPPPAVRAFWITLLRNVNILEGGRLIKAFGPRTDDRLVQSYADHLADVDPYVALKVAAGMHGHSAEDLLPDVNVPALVVVGERDPFTPASLGRHMAAVMPDAILRTLPNATHGAVLEYPEQVNGWVLDFLDRLPAASRPPTRSRSRSTP